MQTPFILKGVCLSAFRPSKVSAEMYRAAILLTKKSRLELIREHGLEYGYHLPLLRG